MKKFECNKRGCAYGPCRYESVNYPEHGGYPCMTPCAQGYHGPTEWREVPETKTKEATPPQQKAWGLHVFDRPDCPEWARWAAVDENGHGHYYSHKPVLELGEYKCWHSSKGEKWQRIDFDFCGAYCTSSLIYRPEKLKQGQWVRYAGDQYGQFIRKDTTGLYVVDTIAGSVCVKDVTPLEVTPWDDQQMRDFVGKVLVTCRGSYIITHTEIGSDMAGAPVIFAMYDKGRCFTPYLLTTRPVLCAGKPCGNIKEL